MLTPKQKSGNIVSVKGIPEKKKKKEKRKRKMTITKRLEKEARRIKEMEVLSAFDTLTKTEIILDLLTQLINRNAITVETTEKAVKIQCHNNNGKPWSCCCYAFGYALATIEKNSLDWNGSVRKRKYSGTEIYNMRDCQIIVTYDN